MIDSEPASGEAAPRWHAGIDPALGVLASVLAVVVLLSADTAAIDPALHPATRAVVALTAVGAAGTGWRRRRPVLGLVAVAGAACLVAAAWQFTGLLPYLTMAALYAVAAHGSRRAAVASLLAVTAAFVALFAAGVPDLGGGDVVTSTAVFLAGVALGDATRQRRARQRDVLAAAEARAEVVGQRAVAESERAVAQERLRIARELHDVVAHSMSLIAVQAGVGAHVLRRDPEAAERALTVIADTSRTALDQVRSVVGLLRSGDDAQPSLPGLVSLDALVAGVRGAGLAVDVRLEGPRRPVPPAVDLAAYRVVQEALTNAVKHAPARPVGVRITYAPGRLLVDVCADGSSEPAEPAPAGAAPGFGLVGLRERARAVGGHLDAAPTTGGGFRVRADLPTGGDAP